jgi:molybdopterin synthase sulfur carrier subunit
VAILRLFAQARESAGAGSVDVPGDTVGQVLDEAVSRFGEQFGLILDGSKVWLNGNPTHRSADVTITDEVAVLPPVSGG